MEWFLFIVYWCKTSVRLELCCETGRKSVSYIYEQNIMKKWIQNTVLLRRSGRAVSLYSTAHKTQLTILQLEDFLPASLFPDLLPQSISGFINNIFRELKVTTKLIINTMSPQYTVFCVMFLMCISTSALSQQYACLCGYF